MVFPSLKWKKIRIYSENKFESFKAGDGRPSTKNWNDPIYDRLRSINTDGTAFTVHKFIKDWPEVRAYYN